MRKQVDTTNIYKVQKIEVWGIGNTCRDPETSHLLGYMEVKRGRSY